SGSRRSHACCRRGARPRWTRSSPCGTLESRRTVMERRFFLTAMPAVVALELAERERGVSPTQAQAAKPGCKPLHPPARGPIDVAFLVSEGATVIDFTGPWEVFQDVDLPEREGAAFRLFPVGASREPGRGGGEPS